MPRNPYGVHESPLITLSSLPPPPLLKKKKKCHHRLILVISHHPPPTPAYSQSPHPDFHPEQRRSLRGEGGRRNSTNLSNVNDKHLNLFQHNPPSKTRPSAVPPEFFQPNSSTEKHFFPYSRSPENALVNALGGLNGLARYIQPLYKYTSLGGKLPGWPLHVTYYANALKTAKPTTAVLPFRAAAAFNASTQRRDASSLTPHAAPAGVAKPRKEVPLASEEGNKGVLQYALYVHSSPTSPSTSAPATWKD